MIKNTILRKLDAPCFADSVFFLVPFFNPKTGISVIIKLCSINYSNYLFERTIHLNIILFLSFLCYQNWEQGMVFTLQEQIDHKAVFIEQELTNNKVPIILV